MRGKPFEVGNKIGKGRPVGSRNKKNKYLEILEGFGELIIRKGAMMAMSGDRMLQRTCIERLIPLAKHAAPRFRIPKMEGTADITKVLTDILKQTAAGRLSPQEAELLARFVESYTRTIGAVEHEERLADLEEDDSEDEAA